MGTGDAATGAAPTAGSEGGSTWVFGTTMAFSGDEDNTGFESMGVVDAPVWGRLDPINVGVTGAGVRAERPTSVTGAKF